MDLDQPPFIRENLSRLCPFSSIRHEGSTSVLFAFFEIGVVNNDRLMGVSSTFVFAFATVMPSTTKDTSLIPGLRSR
jgi:hypothetical protein